MLASAWLPFLVTMCGLSWPFSHNHLIHVVRSCRETEGIEPFDEDTWATKEFYVKWKRWAYIHCSWDSRETLSQLGGYKRVMNYIKRQVRTYHSSCRPSNVVCRPCGDFYCIPC